MSIGAIMHWLDATFFVVTLSGIISAFISAMAYSLEPRRVSSFAIFFFWIAMVCCGSGVIWMLIRKPFTLLVFGIELP